MARKILLSLVIVVFGLVITGCSVQPEIFGKSEFDQDLLKYRYEIGTEWSAYKEGVLLPGYPEQRESVINEDPARGIGLKQANSMAAGEAVLQPGRFRVFLFMGQSNMVGHGKAGKLEAPYDETHPGIRIWSKGKWQYLVPKRNFGPEVSFAHEMVNLFPHDTIGIIKVAVGGTGMNSWKPDWEWSAASKTGDALKGSLYRDMINAVTDAFEVSTFQLSGFIWKQGGRDGRKTELAETYQERFVELVTQMRSDLAAPNLPVFVLTYFDEQGLEKNRALLERLRPKALPLYFSKARVASYLSDAYPIFHGRLPTRIDQVHFDTEGQLKLGIMTAQEVGKYLLTQEKEEPANTKGKIIEPPIP